MLKNISCFTLLTISLLQLHGDSYSPEAASVVLNTGKSNFPLNQDQGWYTKETLLIWKAQEDDVDYGNRFTFDDSFDHSKIRLKKPDFEWSTGVRVGIGRYLPHHELWDVSVFMTYFYNDATSKTTPNFDHGEVVSPAWAPGYLGPSVKSSVNWQLNLFVWDLALGRYITLTPHLTLHPFMGIRAGLIYQKYQNQNRSFAQVEDPDTFDLTFPLIKTDFKLRNDFYGIGPRLGTDFAYEFTSGWSIVGKFAGTLLAAHYNIRTALNGQFQRQLQVTPLHIKAKDGDSVLRTNLEGSLGLQWEKWVHDHKVHIVPSVLFEVSEWYGVNNWFDMSGPINNFNAPDLNLRTDRHYGDLGFLGVTINLQVDF